MIFEILKHKMFYFLLLFAAYLPLILLNQLMAQQQRNQLRGEIDIVKTYQPQLQDAKKLDVPVYAEDLKVEQAEIKYTFESNKVHVQSEQILLEPVRVGRPSLHHITNHYASAGFGNYRTIFAEYHYNTVRSRDRILTAHLRHFSGKGPLDHSNFSNNLVSLSGKKIYDKHVLGSNLKFDNSVYHFYGMESFTDTAFNKDDIRQRFNNFDVSAFFGNKNVSIDNTALKYDLDFYYNNIADFYDATEMSFNLLTHLRRQIQEKDELHLNFDLYFSNFSDSIADLNRNMFDVSGGYEFKRDDWKLFLGLLLATESDTSASNTYVYPLLRAEYKLVGDFLITHAGIKGAINRNDFRSLAQSNPFILSNALDIRNTKELFTLYFGAGGTINSKTGYNLEFSYSNLTDFHFFVNDSLNPNLFRLEYEEGNVNLFSVNAALSYEFNDILDIAFESRFNRYSLSTHDHPWHRPSVEAKLTANYRVLKDLKLSTDIIAVGSRYAKVYNDDPVKLKGIFDLNLGALYSYSNSISVFCDINNVLNKNYQYWNHYPVRGINVLAGVSVSF